MNIVTIEDLLPQEFERTACWLSQESINRWLTGEWRNRTTDPKILAIAARNRKNRLFLVRCDGEPCGLVALADIDPADRTAMAWYLLGDQRFARRGVTSDAVRQMVKRGFQELELASVYAWIMEDNIASRRVLEKSGFYECGRLRQSANSNGHQVDRVYFDALCPTDLTAEKAQPLGPTEK